MSSRTRAILALVLVAAAAALAIRLGTRGRDSIHGADRSRLRTWARDSGGAGVSVLPIRVDAADPDRLRRVAHLNGFHAYSVRCASCHALPDPASASAEAWRSRMEAMRAHIVRAGVMPPADSEWAAIQTFLDRAPDVLRR